MSRPTSAPGVGQWDNIEKLFVCGQQLQLVNGFNDIYLARKASSISASNDKVHCFDISLAFVTCHGAIKLALPD
jgi:hypothetical protein